MQLYKSPESENLLKSSLPSNNYSDGNMMYASSKKILVIEDDTVTLDLFLVALEAEGFETIGAENGFMGIQLAQTHQPDLVICDILMPDIDGYSVLMTLRQNPVTAVIPFIFLTGSKTNADFRKGMELGADDYIMKPSTIEEVLRAIAIRLEKQALFSNWFSSNSQTNPASSPGNSTPAESIFPLVPQFKKVFDFIEANYCQGITLSHVAKAVGYTAPYLTHRLAEKTGDTVNGWIVRRKMAAARSLLVNTTQTIEQIALALGYQNSCHFSRQFRQYHSLPPKNWRKQNQPPQVARSAKVKIIQTRNFVNDYRPVDS